MLGNFILFFKGCMIAAFQKLVYATITYNLKPNFCFIANVANLCKVLQSNR